MTDRIDSNEKTFVDEVKRITSTFSDVLGVGHIAPSDNFFKLGGDSFDAIRVMSQLGGDMHIVTLFEHPTAEKLARYRLYEATRHGVRLVSLHDESTPSGSIAVVGVPFGGGDPTAYRDLFRGNQDVRVFGVDFGDFEVESASDFSALIDTLVTEIKNIDTDQLIVYGHCSGAATAACIASAVVSTISSISLVIAASRPVDDPDAAIREAETTSDYEWGQYLRSLGAFTGLTDAEIDGMLDRGRRDHLISIEAYRMLAHHTAHGVPALVLLGDEDPVTSQSDDVVNQWQNFIDVVKSVNLTGGGHYFVRTHAQEITDTVLPFAARNKKGEIFDKN